MATLAKYSLSGDQVGEVEVDDRFVNFKANGQMVKDYITALRANARQWSANTKGRSEVKHTTRKPHKQKGTGRARQGMTSAPQYKGGGIVFGPKPKFDQFVRINKKERRSAMLHLLAQLLQSGKVLVLESSKMEEPKTRLVAQFLKQQQLGSRVLFVGEGAYAQIDGEHGSVKVSVHNDSHQNLVKSLRNLSKVSFCQALNLSGYDLALAQSLVVTESALQELLEWLGSTKIEKVA